MHASSQVKGARPAGPSGVPGTTEAAGVPRNFAAGQQVAGNPLAPLMNAQNAGALGKNIEENDRGIPMLTDESYAAGFNPFASLDVNTRDPNFALAMMEDPQVQANMNQMLSDPAVLDQIVSVLFWESRATSGFRIDFVLHYRSLRALNYKLWDHKLERFSIRPCSVKCSPTLT